MSKPVERRVMTPDEMEAVELMHSVTYPCASWDKRFMRNLAGCETISEKESAQLWRLFIKYRRQIGHRDRDRLLAIAAPLAAPDLRKLEAARREQARIDAKKAECQAAFSQ